MSGGGDEFGKELSKLPDGSPASKHGDSLGSYSPERLTPSLVMHDVDLPPDFHDNKSKDTTSPPSNLKKV
uniref:Uncharacterized protein n=1 Tax=Oryza barthii TaxID=65489 RepID=A0A0D3HC62_9ORYZ